MITPNDFELITTDDITDNYLQHQTLGNITIQIHYGKYYSPVVRRDDGCLMFLPIYNTIDEAIGKLNEVIQ
jgi:hypothetical protein